MNDHMAGNSRFHNNPGFSIRPSGLAPDRSATGNSDDYLSPKKRPLKMSVVEQMRQVFRDVLQIGERAQSLDPATPLLGNLPELDSMAVATLVASMEDSFEIIIDDDDISAETFETFGSLCSFVESKLAA